MLVVFGFFYLSLVFTSKGITQKEALEVGDNVLKKVFHSRLGNNKMKLGKSRWSLVNYTLQLK